MAQRFPRWIAPVLALGLAFSASAVTRNNDDSCDISLLPAATLLLPYFEVDLDYPAGETTIVTISNVTNLDQIARVTLWTDRGYAVFTFNVYLTGYDVQAIDLYDVIGRGFIVPDTGTGTAVTKRGHYSDRNTAVDLASCARLPGVLDESVILRMQSAFLHGITPYECKGLGGEHENAVGYATIDVVGNCSSNTPADAAYWSNDLRYDNVLLGDYQQIDRTDNLAQGGPLVHIRAIPEGGTPGDRRASAGFPRTFYSRFTKLDGRQPLPSRFAVRWIDSDAARFETSLKIWRESRAGLGASCDDYAADDGLTVQEIVAFDENENATGSGYARFLLPATSETPIDDADAFPQLTSSAGWMYLNLDRSGRDDIASQGWVIASMRAEGRYSVDFDAIALGNGCSAPEGKSEVAAAGAAPIAPSPNEPQNELSSHGLASTNNDDSCDIALLPAATLLLPYFEVDLEGGETTLFTVTNVSPSDQIARVTLWTDYSFPVLTFNVYLTGYDVQSINLYDVIARGVIAPDEGTGTRRTRRGAYSERNLGIELGACAQLPGRLPDAYVDRMQRAFVNGYVPGLGDLQACNNVGNEHDHAVGYATIDLVRNCSTNNPFAEEYWTEDLGHDNVLIGDSQQIDPKNDFAEGSPLVHIRAIPEGGTLAERRALPGKYDPGFQRTFYGRYQPALSPKLDGRQPLPSVFAARWMQGGAAGFSTYLKIWREGNLGREATCATHDNGGIVDLTEIVTFDEAENAVADIPHGGYPFYPEYTLPSTSLTSVRDTSIYPQMGNGAVAGWMYLNLDHGDYPGVASSNWVVTTIRNAGGFSADADAPALGNGCSPPVPGSEIGAGTQVIGPAGNVNP